jgi:hypothetical protein
MIRFVLEGQFVGRRENQKQRQESGAHIQARNENAMHLGGGSGDREERM